jgi:hypothetical protein
MNHTQRKVQVATIVAVMLALLVTTAAYADDTEQIRSVQRLSGTQIGVTVQLPSGVSGAFYGGMWGQHFDCSVVSSSVVYCTGPLSSWMQGGMFYLYSKDTNKEVLRDYIYIPPQPRERKPVVPTCPPQECNPG